MLARAAVEAAIDAVAVTEEIGEVWSCRESGNESSGLVARRKMRRKRRKRLEALDEEMKRDVEDGMVSFGFVRYEHLSPREEAECCLSLKVFLFCNDSVFLLLLVQPTYQNYTFESGFV